MKNVNQQDDFKMAKSEPEENKDLIQSNKKESENSLDKVELMTTNFLFSCMIFLTAIGTCLMIYKLNDFLKPLKEFNQEYNFPSIEDFKITLFCMPIVIVSDCFFFFTLKFLIWLLKRFSSFCFVLQQKIF